MGFKLGKVLGGVLRVAGGAIVGGPAGALAAAGSLLRPRMPVSMGQLQGFGPPPVLMGGASGTVSADSVFVDRTRAPLYSRDLVRIYGPKIGAGISNYPGAVPPSGGGGVPGTQMVPSMCPIPAGRGGGVRFVPSPCSGYHWNTGRYYVFGDCRTGTAAGPVEPGERLVRNRRLNPANAQAARRAVRRLNGTYSLLRSIERSMAKLGGRTARRASAASRKRGCGCKGPCKC